ncbi:1-aminocyclopropane-1-carboxylate oxidase 2-like [Hibiscus syriacus]|uniref:1-aminocyclopropane-1-carboxylate oxidase 2-like n=1 Tax=Hibiscus syriacus TaxID=106335 RepID=A0A6A3AUK8_HIBSY|nr:1-aminocyclopropane-1-carboxylate oxidase 2-like [Hibiscus syriacus]
MLMVVLIWTLLFLKRANELREEGNVKYQNKDYVAALQLYDNALKLVTKTHPDRAVFHSNRAVQPLFVRALLRRARAFEAVGKYEMAMEDVQIILGAEPNNKDGLEIARRLSSALGPCLQVKQDLHSRPSPAALGASAVRGALVAGLGPSLLARPVPKKTSVSPSRGSVVSPKLRLAESSVDALVPIESDADKASGFGMLRLHIVDVSPEQEPPLLEEEDDKLLESQVTKSDESLAHSSLGESVLEGVDTDIEKTEKEASKGKTMVASEDPECKEVEMDDLLFEFAQLFRNHAGLDPDAHIDLHELGMEHCSEALEETVTSEEAQILFDKAAAKFQEVVALAFFNWGNVYMCAARKQIPLDESAGEENISTFRQCGGEDETCNKNATKMWEKLEQQRLDELTDPNSSKEELSKRRKRPGNAAENEIPGTVIQGIDGWKKNLDTAVENFKLAGASEPTYLQF